MKRTDSITTGNRGMPPVGNMPIPGPKIPSPAYVTPPQLSIVAAPFSMGSLPVIARPDLSFAAPASEAEREAVTKLGLGAAEASAELLLRANSELLQNSKMNSRQIEGSLGRNLKISDRERFIRIMRTLLDRHALSVVSQLSDLYENIFFIEILPEIYEDAKRITAARANESPHKNKLSADNEYISRAIEDIETGLMFLDYYRKILGPLAREILLAINAGSLIMDECGFAICARSNPVVDRFCGLEHDIGNIGVQLVSIPECARSGTAGDFSSLIDVSEFDISEAGALMLSVAGLLSHEARRRRVRFEVERPALKIAVPAHLQRSLFRLVFELALNGLKNTDEKKVEDQRLLRLGTVESGGGLRFVVADTGTGMNVKKRIEQGVTGRGIAVSIADLKRTHGLSVEFKSQPGKGTIVTVSIPGEKLHEAVAATTIQPADIAASFLPLGQPSAIAAHVVALPPNPNITTIFGR